MKGLAVHTAKIIDQVSMLECIKPYYLVGGTALSLQLHHRLSEDLDFMRWSSRKGEKKEVDWVDIEKQLKTIGELEKTEIMGFEHVEFIVSGVKFSFYDCDKPSPIRSGINYLNHIVLADADSIAIMKMEVLLRRSKFRDYYDLYCIFKDKSNAEIKSLIDAALKYSGHRLKTKNLIAILTSGNRFANDAGFKQLAPIYDISVDGIVNFMGERLKEIYK